MKVIVAGSAGFIGYHLTHRLLRDGHHVLGVDNLSTGSRRNLEILRGCPDFRFLQHDIVTPLPVEGAWDRVYDLACPASPLDFPRRRLEILDVCSRGVANLLELARRTGARLLHASTSEVYGDPREHPQPETYWGNVNPIGPRACYDEGKRFAEALCTSYAAQHGIQVRLPRIFNTYGPNMRRDDGRMLPTFIDQALRNEPLTVHGDGSQTRSFCEVSDLVDGLLLLMEGDESQPVNLGNPSEITVLEAAEEIIRLSNSRSTISFVQRPGDDPALRRPDITRAQQSLGWTPRVTRAEGFLRTIEWMRAHADTIHSLRG